ncbi:flagellar motor protein MotD [Caldichromatium japonicum]|uniref:Flagellar motor protein MotD n=1 Tax=Caldichromatium japonicum TaxID=2699430 RepID=A0A6G7VG34_9GAMM|nr:flagellar motor protein MotD [Caldichromatium japonicum]QIK38912.1 flagellar motor protein MotD [Caldichromatium japonicum]
MARRRPSDEHLHHEAWAIPYGDLLTLLLAFFIAMYAVSVVDADKYQVLSQSLSTAFSVQTAVDPIQIGEPTLEESPVSEDVPRSLSPPELISGQMPQQPTEMDPPSPTAVALAAILGQVSKEERERIASEIQTMSNEIQATMGELVEDGRIQIKRQPYWIEVAINSNLLFSSGSATLDAGARPLLTELAEVLKGHDIRIHVEGHTDNRPISNVIYPSNWELSSGRAATVVNLFAQNGVEPDRMVAIGYGEFHPIESNATEAGRARNRRVSIIVLPALSETRSSALVEPERLRADWESGSGARP